MVDAGSMLNGPVLTASDAEAFATPYDQRRDEFEQLVSQILPPLVEATPDRVMPGMDLATAWNTDPAVYSRVMDWAQAASTRSQPSTSRRRRREREAPVRCMRSDFVRGWGRSDRYST